MHHCSIAQHFLSSGRDTTDMFVSRRLGAAAVGCRHAWSGSRRSPSSPRCRCGGRHLLGSRARVSARVGVSASCRVQPLFPQGAPSAGQLNGIENSASADCALTREQSVSRARSRFAGPGAQRSRSRGSRRVGVRHPALMRAGRVLAGGTGCPHHPGDICRVYSVTLSSFAAGM